MDSSRDGTLANPGIEPRPNGDPSAKAGWTELERRLERIWAEVLARGPLDRLDDFFSLNGSSITVIQMLARVRDETGVHLSFQDVFRAPVLCELAEVIEKAQLAASDHRAPVIGRSPPREEYPLSHSQARLWFLEQLYPGMPAYRTITGIHFRGALRPQELQTALGKVVARHGCLRASFRSHDGVPVQVIHPPQSVPLPMQDLSGLPPSARETEVRRLAREDVRSPLDLEKDPMLRARLLRLDDDEHVLLLTIHHIVFDAWSRNVLERELAAFYREACGDTGPAAPLAALPLEYVDYAVWQHTALHGERLEVDRAYWKGHLGQDPTPLELTPDHPRPSVPGFEGLRETLAIPSDLGGRLRDLAVREGATVAALLLAAFQALLHRYTESDSIVVGLLVAGRNHAGTEPLIGLFVNELALRVDVAPDQPFTALLAKTREAMHGALAHQDLPLDEQVRMARPARQIGQSPLFHVAFNYKPKRQTEADFGEGLSWAEVLLDSGVAPFDLTLDVERVGDTMTFHFDYSRDLFQPATVKRMAGHLRVLLEGLVAEPDQPVARLPMTAESERAHLRAWNDTALPFRDDACLQALFEEQVTRTPGAIAVVGDGTSLTYDELNRRANQLAHHLRSLGVGPEVIVGLVAERSPATLVGLLAILKAGGAYVPLGAALPRDRVALILEDAHVPLVLAARHPTWDLDFPGIESVRLDDPTRAACVADESVENPVSGATPGSLAYVIYTSGSTGRPKGVLIEHRAAVNMYAGFEAAVLAHAPRRPLKVSFDASMSFDASVEQILNLLGGHTLFTVPDEVRLDARAMVAFVRRNSLDVIDWVPTQMKMLLEEGLLDPAHWRPGIVVVGGEAVEEDLWMTMSSAGVETFNTYGPTECTVQATVCRITGRRDRPHIGGPMANLQTHVLDRHLQQVPVGVPGELYLGGEGVARGYLNRPELTSERFIPDPFGDRPDTRLYRTGDRVRWVDGNLEFLGRIDDQVKIRGMRIEPGEIEATLAQHPGVREAAVDARMEAGGGKFLAAYVALKSGAAEPSSTRQLSEIREFLRSRLPEHMVPAAFVAVDELPRNPSGKVNRRALPDPDRSNLGGGHYSPPSDDLESELVAIWQRLLKLDRVGIDDRFFDIGGHSLLTVQLAQTVESKLCRTCSLAMVFETGTIRTLAARLRSGGAVAEGTAGGAVEGATVVALRATGTGRQFFCICGVHLYQHLADRLAPEFRTYGIFLPYEQELFAASGSGARSLSVEDMAAGYLKMVRQQQPRGPYLLAGISFGGILAYQMAQELLSAGEKVDVMVLLDTMLPGARRRNWGRWAVEKLVRMGRGGASGLLRRAGDLLGWAPGERGEATASEANLVDAEARRLADIREAIYGEAMNRYRASPYPGTVLLARAEDKSFYASDIADETYGWGSLVANLGTCDVPGDHIGILTEPHVSILAERLRRYLRGEGESGEASQLPPAAP